VAGRGSSAGTPALDPIDFAAAPACRCRSTTTCVPRNRRPG